MRHYKLVFSNQVSGCRSGGFQRVSTSPTVFLKLGMASLMLASLLLAFGVGPGISFQGAIQPPPKELEGIGVDEKLNSSIPLELSFVSEDGQSIQLKQFFSEGKPVALTLNYYECPMLCTLQLNGVAEAVRELGFVPGNEFELVTISINPEETPELAAEKKENYISYLRMPQAFAGWHFLTGQEDNIKALTDAVGFKYRFNPETGEFAHVAVLVILTPKGVISRYLYGVMYDSRVLRLSLIEASQGKIGTPLDQVLLYCYRYDATTGRYTPVVMNIVRLSGLATVVLLAIFLGTFWAKDVYRQKRQAIQES